MMSIRQATKADMERLVDLKLEVHNLHVDHAPYVFTPVGRDDLVAEFAAVLRAPDAWVFVACEGLLVVGYTVLILRERPEMPGVRAQRWLYVQEIDVAEAHRGRGHAAALIETARAVAREQALGRVELDTWGFNERAQAFFRGQGFRPVTIKMGIEV